MKIIKKRGREEYNSNENDAAEDSYYTGNVRGSFDEPQDIPQENDYQGYGEDTRGAYSTSTVSQSKEAGTQIELKVLRPTDYTDGPMIADELANGNTVVLTIEGMEPGSIMRLMDFLLGAIHVLGGDMRRVSGTTLVLAPQNTNVTGFEAFGEQMDDADDESDDSDADSDENDSTDESDE